MKLSSEMIYYWIHEKYKSAVLKKRHRGVAIMTEAPVFYESSHRINGRFVVVDVLDINYVLTHEYPESVFLITGKGAYLNKDIVNECIFIPEEVPIGCIFNMVMDIFELFAQWERDLIKARRENLSYHSIIKSCNRVLPVPMGLLDAQYKYVGYSRDMEQAEEFENKYVDGNNLPYDIVNHMANLEDYESLNNIENVYNIEGYPDLRQKNVFCEGRYIGRLVALYSQEDPGREYFDSVLDIVAEQTEKLYDRLQTFWHKKNMNIAVKELLKDMVNGIFPPRQSLESQLESFGFSPGDDHILIQLTAHFSNSGSGLNNVLAAHLEAKWLYCTCFTDDKRFFLLLNHSKYSAASGDDFLHQLAEFLRENLYLAGVSRVFCDMYDIRAAAVQTNLALEIGTRTDKMYWYFKFDDYALKHILESGTKGFSPEQIGALAVFRLMDHDEKKGTDLSKTLREYINQRFNATTTATLLGVARSTLLNRLDRIEQITEMTLDDPRDLLYLLATYALIEG